MATWQVTWRFGENESGRALLKCSSSKKIAQHWLRSTALRNFLHSAMLPGLSPLVLHLKGARTSSRRPISTSNGPAPLCKLLLLVWASADRQIHEIDGRIFACVIITTATRMSYRAVRSPGSTVEGPKRFNVTRRDLRRWSWVMRTVRWTWCTDRNNSEGWGGFPEKWLGECK